MVRQFHDRREAGRLLGQRLLEARSDGHDLRGAVVLGLPRGGVPVAFEVATALEAPLDVLVVRKLGVPWHPELGMGAVGEDGVTVVSDSVVRSARVSAAELAEVERHERAEVAARAVRFRGGRPPLPIAGQPVVIVDDGLATGGTAKAAVQVARARGAAWVVLAVPVAPPDAVDQLARVADEVVCLVAPRGFSAVGSWYRDFRQTSDQEVLDLLAEAAGPGAPTG